MQDQESKRTIVYLLVAGMALLVAWEPWYRVPEAQTAPVEVGHKLFPDFTDPLKADSLEVFRYDEGTSTIRPFKVAKVNGVWSIPSHSNYPADAREHMADAATALLDITILGVASTSPGDQELYGVIAPDAQKLRQGATGVGTQITMKDKDKTLADLIVGKEVKERPGLRYVRRADRDQICVVEVKTDKLSTKFEDWIEKDLLKLQQYDVRDVELNDYSLEEGVTPQGGIGLRMHPRSKLKLKFDDSKSAWSLVEMTEFDEKGQPVASQLAEDEELNSEKLNNLKSALDDLQIVDVERKPKGLSQDLRASEEFVKDNEARASLITRGFYPVPRDGQIEMYSSEGEATCTTKDGVRYVLRFGHLAGGDEPMGEEGEKKEEKKSSPALNRFLFVMAQFDDSQIAQPKLEPVPGEDAESKEGEKPAETKEGENPADAKPQDNAKPDADKVPEEKTAAQDEAAKDEKPAADAEKKDAADAKPEEKKEAAPATPEEEKILAIKRENKRRTDEYNDAVKKGQDKVKELNDRFADWYFIISDDVYKKIHLGRADVVKLKEKKEDAADKEPAAPGAEAKPE